MSIQLSTQLHLQDFENSYSLSYIPLKSCLRCCSLVTLAPQQLIKEVLSYILLYPFPASPQASCMLSPPLSCFLYTRIIKIDKHWLIMFSFYFKMQPSERGTCKRLNYLQILYLQVFKKTKKTLKQWKMKTNCDIITVFFNNKRKLWT